MNEDIPFETPAPQRRNLKTAILILLVLMVTAAHWWMPRAGGSSHVAHVALRKLYLLPIVLAAIWFELRGSLLTAVLSTILYVPHVLLQWGGEWAENVNQMGEVATIGVTAVLGGLLAGREKDTLRKLSVTYQGTVRALAMALDAREHNTEKHSLRVCAYTLRLGRELRMPQRRQQINALGALLHDVGKIGISDEILLKPGPLSDLEWKHMRKHPTMGRRILASVPFLRRATRIVEAHHEKFDGTGYPHGRAGASIPQGARIFAVADVFDALTSRRPYRRPATYDDARSVIEEESGRHFDPEVVDAFLRIPAHEWEGIRSRVDGEETPNGR